jgi:tellurite resistance protein
MNQRIRHFPVSFFSVVMGLAGFAIAVQRAEKAFKLPAGGGDFLAIVSATVFAALAVAYLAKFHHFPAEVRKELAHPVRLSFLPTISISLILLSIAAEPTSVSTSFWLLVVGAPMHLLFTLFVLSRWVTHTTFEIHHSNPSWFIPVVGNILVPIAALPHGVTEISWFFFSVGLVFWLVLLTIIFYRVIFHHPLPGKLVPTLFILVAPPAVGFISYIKLAGGLDTFARVLYYTALFTMLMLVTLYRQFRGIKFFLSWWAYSFPTAAFTIASLLMYKLTGQVFFQALAWLMLAILGVIIAGLAVRTLTAVLRGEICVEE